MVTALIRNRCQVKSWLRCGRRHVSCESILGRLVVGHRFVRPPKACGPAARHDLNSVALRAADEAAALTYGDETNPRELIYSVMTSSSLSSASTIGSLLPIVISTDAL